MGLLVDGARFADGNLSELPVNAEEHRQPVELDPLKEPPHDLIQAFLT